MKFHDRHAWAAYESPYLAITFRRRDARLAFLGIDSGGRRWDHKNTYNLLKPSQGALVPAIDRVAKKPPEFLPPRPAKGGASSPSEPPPVPADWLAQSACEAGLAAESNRVAFAFSPVDDRTFDISVESKDGAPLKGPFWEMSLQIKTAPPTIWAETKMDDPVQVEARNHAHPRHPECNELARRVWRLPMVVHFPDFGHVRIEAAEGEADCLERLLKSEEFSGLNLGFLNLGSHTQNCGLHYGRSLLAFRPKKGCKRAVLRFTVLPEIAPHPATGEDFTKDPKWDGFRRNYLNGFTLHRQTLTMGDNIVLAGYAHLAVQNKADLLDLAGDSDDPTLALIRRIFIHQTDAAMRAQDADGEINWDYPHEPKKPGMKCGKWVDTTPANMIAACTCLRWEPRHAKKWYPALVRAADYLIGMDEDGDAILENPFAGRFFFEAYDRPGSRPVNWWDNIAYGHKDAWYNLLSHRALRLVGDLAAKRGVDGALRRRVPPGARQSRDRRRGGVARPRRQAARLALHLPGVDGRERSRPHARRGPPDAAHASRRDGGGGLRRPQVRHPRQLQADPARHRHVRLGVHGRVASLRERRPLRDDRVALPQRDVPLRDARGGRRHLLPHARHLRELVFLGSGYLAHSGREHTAIAP